MKPGNGALSVRYRPANPSFGSDLHIPYDVPDLAAPGRQFQKIQPILDRCIEELDPFSRWMAQNPPDPTALAGAAKLPARLLREHGGPRVERLLALIGSAPADGETREVEAAALIGEWTGDPEGVKLTPNHTRALADLLGKLGWGMEPDPAFDGPALTAPGAAVLFPLSEKCAVTRSEVYGRAAAAVGVAVLLALADGPLNAAEERVLNEFAQVPAVSQEGERERLCARMRRMRRTPPLARDLKKFAGLIGTQAGAVLPALVRVVVADGPPTPAELTALSKVYAALGLPDERLYSDIHALATAAPVEPVTIRPAEPAARRGRRIPAPPPEETRLRLNDATIARKERETAEVASLLGAVFADDEPTAPAATPTATNAAGYGLLAAGAIETINDAAFELTGDAVCEGGDPIEVALDIAARMLTEAP